MSWQMPLAANSGAIHSEADANQPLQYPPLMASSTILASQMPSTDCQSQAQDTSGLTAFPPPPDASHDIDSMPEFGSQAFDFDQGSNEISNFHGFPYNFDPNQEFNFDIPFDANLLDLGKNVNTPDLMLPFSPGSPSNTHSITIGSSAPTPASAFTLSAFNDAFIYDAAPQRTVSSDMPRTAESMFNTHRITSTSIEPTSGAFHNMSDTTNMRSAAPECTVSSESLDGDIQQFLTKQNDEIAKIATAHNVKVDKVKDLVGFNIHYKKQRKPTLHNAILHLKATEINQEDELINNLLEHRDNRKHGVCANNAAAARDILCMGDAMTDLLDGCAHRTSSYGFYFLTRGHVNDTTKATWYGSDNSMDFLEDILQLEPSEVCQLFEQWACSRHQSADERDSLDNVRKQCTCGILMGLRTLKNNKKLEMNYVNYDKAIVLGLGVKLVGWPKAISFAKPSSIGSVVDACMLHDALKSGECHWIKLTTRQIDDHRGELENCEAEGEMIGKPRKKRSDAGKKRKGHSSDNIENEQPTKKTRHTTKSAKTTKRPVRAASDANEDHESESGSDLYG
ncbi:hypothetical protein PILCRDRAFT_85516 [Piloderma croceum F 1598]|uniref:Uncharacterized protein n=1 Tax=Piloderma croceum (strain F 1598) TaxID=765440 RepID=A0A0C3GCD3_PILCF|nr:hypothetical protein PILCRDRAFT_85516 [Piloderma croceum F 1598]